MENGIVIANVLGEFFDEFKILLKWYKYIPTETETLDGLYKQIDRDT